jgi:tricorn protease
MAIRVMAGPPDSIFSLGTFVAILHPLRMRIGNLLVLSLLTLTSAANAQNTPAKIDARMMRYPDVSSTQLVFVYAGDIWVAPKIGGQATRLSSPRGEEAFPKFSPDGSRIAYTANYDGNGDIYVVPTSGGLPVRVTHHGAYDRVVDWYPDGTNILFASIMDAPKDRFNQLFRVPASGGLPERLPLPYGEFGSISSDGKTLAYTPISVDFRTWKRYRGGMNPDIWLIDLETKKSRNVTKNDAADSIPMWRGDTLYFLSDRDAAKRANLWAWDRKTDKTRQLTAFKEYDVQFPSMGPDEIVFENAGKLYLFDLQTEKSRMVEITVLTDRATLKPAVENVSGLIQSWSASPSGKRALFEARGDIFNAPAEQGVTRNVTRSSGVAERWPAWSPDGKRIAYFSDRTGEYELTVRPADGTGEEETLTKLGPGFRYSPQWSPDSKKVAFIDAAMQIQVYDLEAKTNRVIGKQLWAYHGDLNGFAVSWSADSRWIAWGQHQDNRNSAIVLYDYPAGKVHQVTAGFYDDDSPRFDPDGKYLWFRSGRTFSPSYSDLDNSWVYRDSQMVAIVPLKSDTASPFAPKNDEEEKAKSDDKKSKDKEEKDKDKTAEDGKNPGTNAVVVATNSTPSTNIVASVTNSAAGGTNTVASAEKKDDKKDDKDKPKPVEIEIDGFERRALIVPIGNGPTENLIAVSGGKLVYSRKNNLYIFDLEKKEEKTIISNCNAAELTADGKKLLVRAGGSYGFVEPSADQKLSKTIPTSGFEMTVDPVAEWAQIFNDAWRLERDLFYDPGMHGVDWPKMKERYNVMMRDAVTRWDVNYVLGELIGELNSSHTYRSGGDMERSASRGVGYLGCDYVLTNGVYRFGTIYDGAQWDSEVRSPLRRPGLNIAEGTYLLEVNGEPLDTTQDPWAAFQGLADKTVLLTISTNATREGSREVLVQCLGSEYRLRNLAWIEANRRKVDELSGGKVGYVYVPDTGQNGQNELVRQWRGQVTKDGLVIDERFNSGGQIPDRFVEMLNRPLRNYWGVRDGKDWSWPPVTHAGPKAMLINGWSGSGGDCFPYYFKQSGLGPLIGTRTWGGLIGITGAPPLIDGGSVTVPTFGIYDMEGRWIIESTGVDPDIEVVDDPAAMANGGDPQLERAVQEVLKTLKEHPPKVPKKPAYPNRSGV